MHFSSVMMASESSRGQGWSAHIEIPGMNEICPWCRATHHYPVACVNSVVACGSCGREFLLAKGRRDDPPQSSIPPPRQLREMWEIALYWAPLLVWSGVLLLWALF
jgi:hypothetical protein